MATLACFLVLTVGEFHLSFTFGVVLQENSSKYLIQYVEFVSSIGIAWGNVMAVIRTTTQLTLISCSIAMFINIDKEIKKCNNLAQPMLKRMLSEKLADVRFSSWLCINVQLPQSRVA